MLNRGLYDLGELSRLCQVHPEVVRRWTRTHGHLPAIVTPSLNPYFSFLDLITVHVAAELRLRHVSDDDIRRGVQLMSAELSTDRPLAHRRLATVGRSFFADLGEWVDAGKGGQGAFLSVIKPVLKPIEYDPDEMAKLWRPRPRVWLNPLVQTGAPCVDGHRLPTKTLADMVDAGDDPEEVADNFEVSLKDVEAAVRFEHELLTPAA
jgi:uncharacterized protein (DUF433 family)